MPVEKKGLEENLERYLGVYLREASQNMGRSEEFLAKRQREHLHREKALGQDEFLLIKQLDVAGKRVLEVGSGSGWFSVRLALQGARVYGVEPSLSGVRASMLRAQRYDGIVAHFVQGVGEQLPYPDDFFDLVVSNQVLEHVRDLAQVLAEVYRVTRTGGASYHWIPNYGYPYEGHYRMFWIPYLPRPVYKLYARARAKPPALVDELNLIYRRSILRQFRRTGFAEVQDYYPIVASGKVASEERVISPIKRHLLRICKRLGLAQVVLGMATRLGLFPNLIIGARKV